MMAMAHLALSSVNDVMKSERRKKWKNHDGNQSAFPLRQYQPGSLEDIVTIIREAEALRLTVRPIGSSHSWSDVCVTPDFMVLPFGINKTLTLDRSLLRSTADPSELVEVESGIRLRELNEFLDQRGLALPNMGGYDGQTIVGVISTSTHGSGLTFGPLPEIVQSMDIVASAGNVYRIEPSDGITDAAAYHNRYPGRILKQDDKWFRAVLVSMGCMGVIYSVIIKVVPKFWLKETRSLTTWENIKPELHRG